MISLVRILLAAMQPQEGEGKHGKGRIKRFFFWEGEGVILGERYWEGSRVKSLGKDVFSKRDVF